MNKKRILSGMRSTGPLHLGNYHGALENWAKMQEEYDCLFFVADWHALTSEYEDARGVAAHTKNMMLDWLSAGLSPEKSVLFVQSHIKEHAELFLILSMITPVPWLERNPTYKDQIVQLSSKDLSTFGFLGYPVLQAADIIMYKTNGVPVGIDQVPHVEITREVVRKFNTLYADIFPEPQSILTPVPRLLGTDRRKMSKSYNNAVYLSESPEGIKSKVSKMITDPARMKKKDPGNPDICNVFDFHKLYSPAQLYQQITQDCKNAAIGCVDCKKLMAENLIQFLNPIREKRKFYQQNPKIVDEIIAAGNQKARGIAQETMQQVREVVKI